MCICIHVVEREREKEIDRGTTLRVLILSSTQKKTVKENKDMLIGGLRLNCSTLNSNHRNFFTI